MIAGPVRSLNLPIYIYIWRIATTDLICYQTWHYFEVNSINSLAVIYILHSLIYIHKTQTLHRHKVAKRTVCSGALEADC